MDNILKGIYTALNRNPGNDISLIGGRAGIALFNFAYLKYQAPGEAASDDSILIQELAERSLEESANPSFSTGTAGINWLFSYLYKNDILAKEDWEFLSAEDSTLETTALNMLRHGNYDFLHGAMGIGYYFLYSGTHRSNRFFEEFFSLLNRLPDDSADKNMIPGFDFTLYKAVPAEVNLGFAHGISGILKFCLQCYKQGICTSESKLLAQSIVEYLVSKMNKDKSISYFPNRVVDGRRADEFSRLAWCYGDLGIALTLYQFGVLFDDVPLADLALGILEHSTGRRMESTTQVRDAGFCHGSAGLAHLYNRIWLATYKSVFKEASEHWLQKTIELAKVSYDVTEYEKYDARNGKFETCYGLLEGSAGIGLALLSCLTGDCSWDYCLMLND
jgi:lantibiotic modifying enzyme